MNRRYFAEIFGLQLCGSIADVIKLERGVRRGQKVLKIKVDFQGWRSDSSRQSSGVPSPLNAANFVEQIEGRRKSYFQCKQTTTGSSPSEFFIENDGK